MTRPNGAPLPTKDQMQQRWSDSSTVARRTPAYSLNSLSELCGGDIYVKAESLQRTGSFKLRGSLSKLSTLDPSVAEVVTGSAGNHAQALAYAARAKGIACTVYMPSAASLGKIRAVEAFGATVREGGDSVDSCVQQAREHAAGAKATFVHPFDDIDVVIGQAGVGIELIDQVPDIGKVIVPVGGGGLAAGLGLAIRTRFPNAEIVGVQADACAPYADLRHLRAARETLPTIADGIAIKRPGALVRPLLEHVLDDIITVRDEAIAEAMVFLLERAKLVTEGAGAAAAAALLSGVTAPAEFGTTAVILSGGNVDVGVIASLIARHETVADRRLRLFTRVSDRPGGLAELLQDVAGTGASVREVTHLREGVELQVSQTGIELLLETRGPSHAEVVTQQLVQAGHELERLSESEGAHARQAR